MNLNIDFKTNFLFVSCYFITLPKKQPFSWGEGGGGRLLSKQAPMASEYLGSRGGCV